MIKKELEKLKKTGEVYLQLKAIPGSSRTEIKERMADETLKVSLASVAEKGKANKKLITFLAKIFETDKGNIKIISGAGTRTKLIKIIK